MYMIIINKDELNISNIFCHKIIKQYNKFIVDYNLSDTTNSTLIPSSHFPINFIKTTSDEIFDIINNDIFIFIF